MKHNAFWDWVYTVFIIVAGMAFGYCIATNQINQQRIKQEREQFLAKELDKTNEIEEVVKETEDLVKELVEDEKEEVYQADLELMARVVYAESGNQAFVGKVAVATTIINRSEMWGRTIESVIREPNQYVIGETTNDECRRAVEYAWANRDLFPSDLLWFTSQGYSYGYPYVRIGAHFFSTESQGRGK